MKILMVSKTIVGGVNVHINEIRKELVKNGVEVDNLTLSEDLSMTKFYSSYSKAKDFFRKVSKDYDTVHTHDWSVTYPALKSGIKNIVATFHGFPMSIPARYFQNYCMNKLKEKSIVISPKMKREFEHSTYIPNGVNLDFFRPTETKRENNLVGMAQILDYGKESIMKVISELNLKWIETGGKMPFERLPDFYSRIGIFISLPYKQTGFNMSWLEAMSCEVPYIIGTDKGIGEELPIYKVKTKNELRDLIEAINLNKIEPIKDERNWIVKNDFTWERTARELKALYEMQKV